ncbi:MAG TPA: hydroxyacid dehydrogenase [Thermomicrobiales bacterium]|nr:hydroxyacid dehydrogenase [Thermomicrobiales bacterium]
MSPPRVYLAIGPDLVGELALDEELPRLAGVAEVERWPGPGAPTPEAVAAALRAAPVVVTGWDTPPLAPLADWTPDGLAVRLVAHTAGTVRRLLPVAALERGLRVTHANESLAEAVAEFTVGAIIMARRRAFHSFARYREGRPRLPLAGMRELGGSTVGVIGAGSIGRRVLRLLAPFGVTLLLHDPYCPPATAAEYAAELVALPDLLRRSDVVTLHAPVTDETRGMLGAAEFAAMKDGALFVNTARGRLLDADALLAELRTGRIAALLDVTDPTEPLPPDSPFFALENCVVLPHMAALTVEARRRQSRITVDEILRFLRGEPLRHEITRARWETMA